MGEEFVKINSLYVVSLIVPKKFFGSKGEFVIQKEPAFVLQKTPII